MGRTVSMATLVTNCLTAADLESQTVISSAQCKVLIDRAYRQLYGELAKPGVGYFDTEATISTTGGATYALPSDHMWTVGIDYEFDAVGHRRPLTQLMEQERVLYEGNTGQAACAYRATSTNVVLYPTPPTGQTYRHRYIPQPTDISTAADGTLIEMATLDGEEFLVWTVVYFLRDKLDLDTRTAAAEREAARVRVAEDAALRAFHNMPRRIIQEDIEDMSAYDPGSFRWNPP